MYKGIADGQPFAKTVAEGIALAAPNKGMLVVNAVRDTGGEVLCADESEIVAALKETAAQGFFVEPTSATAYAGIKQLAARGVLGRQDDVIMIVSGNGLKASVEITELYKKGVD